MKFLITIIFSSIALVLSAPSLEIEESSTKELFGLANIYQAKAEKLQAEVNTYMVSVRLAIPDVLKVQANDTLSKIEGHSDRIFVQESTARGLLFTLPVSTCVMALRDFLNKITEFSGFELSNCVARYDLQLSELIKYSYDNVEKYEKTFGDILHVVVRSFIGYNTFFDAAEISDKFIKTFEGLKEKWDGESKDIDAFKALLNAQVNRLNNNLASCFFNLQEFVDPSYDVLISQISTCAEFDNSHDPYAIFFV